MRNASVGSGTGTLATCADKASGEIMAHSGDEALLEAASHWGRLGEINTPPHLQPAFSALCFPLQMLISQLLVQAAAAVLPTL